MPKNGTLRLDNWQQFQDLKNRMKNIPKGLSHDEWLKLYQQQWKPNKHHAKMTEAAGIKFSTKKAAAHAFECKQIPAAKFELFSYDLGWA